MSHYRVEYKSKVRQSFEIYKVENGLDVECFITDFLGNIEEYFRFDLETNEGIKLDHKEHFKYNMAVIKEELHDAIIDFEYQNEDTSPQSFGELLLEPYRSLR